MYEPYTYTYTYSETAAASTSIWATLFGSFFAIACWVAVYLFIAFILYRIAKRLGSDKAWWAFVPILNILLMLELAEMSYIWILAFFVPLLNLVAAVMIWLKILEKLGKPSWHVVLLFVPLVNFIYLVMLALESGEAAPKASTAKAEKTDKSK